MLTAGGRKADEDMAVGRLEERCSSKEVLEGEGVEGLGDVT